MESEPIPPAPSRARVVAFAVGGRQLGATTSALFTTFQFTKLYPGGLRAMTGIERIMTYLLTMTIGTMVGTANGTCKALYGKSLWRIVIGV
jgi:hypothetical protein